MASNVHVHMCVKAMSKGMHYIIIYKVKYHRKYINIHNTYEKTAKKRMLKKSLLHISQLLKRRKRKSSLQNLLSKQDADLYVHCAALCIKEKGHAFHSLFLEEYKRNWRVLKKCRLIGEQCGGRECFQFTLLNFVSYKLKTSFKY